MLLRITYGFIYFLALIFILYQFPTIRNIGTIMLASAGVAGIVVGLAAQSTLGNFIAGTALAFSQPIRLNDAVIYQRDFGTVEEITLLHTVIRTWDNQRIVVPNSR